MIDHCSRCGASGVLAVPLYRPTGMAWFTPPDFTAKSESACAQCITDDELARLLYPVASFVTGTIARTAANACALETTQAYFAIRNNGTSERDAALKAIGLLV